MSERENEQSGFIRDIVGCLISPRSSFKSILEKPSLMKATALILVIAIIGAWASFNYAGKLPLTSMPLGHELSVNPEQLRQMWMIVSAIMMLIGIFGTWLISSALVHGFSKPLGGKGVFRDLLTLSGYASLPLIVQQLLRLADSFIVGQEGLQFTTSFQISAYPLLNSIANAAVDVFTIFRLWSIVLLIIAASENYKISKTRSTVATVLAFIIIVLISAFLPLV